MDAPCAAPDAARAAIRAGAPVFAAFAAGPGPKTVEQPEVDTKTQTQRPWNVIVHDDPVTLMSYVTRVFMDVFHYSRRTS
jgi:hypothetical protein